MLQPPRLFSSGRWHCTLWRFHISSWTCHVRSTAVFAWLRMPGPLSFSTGVCSAGLSFATARTCLHRECFAGSGPRAVGLAAAFEELFVNRACFVRTRGSVAGSATVSAKRSMFRPSSAGARWRSARVLSSATRIVMVGAVIVRIRGCSVRLILAFAMFCLRGASVVGAGRELRGCLNFSSGSS